ncbi:hypothetical protein BS47DRAFT_1408893 [Hydnum rufescens UP504]|uniref:Fungal-type protein kinase domain-containing protein n=1 Tax=Hydnum rufescens UP504 TaxID=1448309 RepID=A0A9P6E1C1_9AGAM|nr:hypothetical protein BS47DRAFT_1408893 [Hydnum rufescens UP504]
MDAAERLSTPPNCPGPLPSLSTSEPFSNNVSGYASTSDRDRFKLHPLLNNDLKNTLVSSFEDFLQDVFEFKPSNGIDLEKICQNDETLSHLQAFLSSLTKPEVDQYRLFTDLVNHMSSLIAAEEGRECSIFARDHHSSAVLSSLGTTRYPDVVFTQNQKICSAIHCTGPMSAVIDTAKQCSTPSGGSSAPSNASTGSKHRHGASTSDNALNESPRTQTSKINQDTLQLATYALESFYHGPYRSHVVHGMIQGSTLELWYYDRVGAVRSGGVNFAEDLVLLAQFLTAIAHLSETSWGLHPRINYPRSTPLPQPPCPHPRSRIPNSTDEKGSSLGTKRNGSLRGSSHQSARESQLDKPFGGATITIQDRTFVLGDCVFRQYALVGRGTCVIEADGGTVVVKLSWPENTRTPEYEFLERAYTSAKEYGDGNMRHMKDHLPVLEAKEDFGEWGPRSRILARRSTLDLSRMGSRILRVTVYQKLERMIELRTADDLMSVMGDIALCHRWLYRVMGILHRDISMNNIMFRRNGAKVIGVLIDYDLAIDINKPSRSSLERTGVRRFMAVDLMEDTRMLHHARHDMESMFWVLVWFTFRHQDGKEIRVTPRSLEDWITTPTLDDLKRSFFIKIKGAPTAPFAGLMESCIIPLKRLFRGGHFVLEDYNQSVATWDKHDHGAGLEPPNRPAFPRDAVFYDDNSMWIALWNVFKPADPIEFDDVCNSARLGFLPPSRL